MQFFFTTLLSFYLQSTLSRVQLYRKKTNNKTHRPKMVYCDCSVDKTWLLLDVGRCKKNSPKWIKPSSYALYYNMYIIAVYPCNILYRMLYKCIWVCNPCILTEQTTPRSTVIYTPYHIHHDYIYTYITLQPEKLIDIIVIALRFCLIVS